MTTPVDTPANITGVILAGGLSRRMLGGHKVQTKLDGATLLQHTQAKASIQVTDLLLSSNTPELAVPQGFCAVIQDTVKGFMGPLAGILAAMEWCNENRPQARWLASFTVDAPFIPVDLVQRFQHGLNEIDAEYVCAASYGRRHPLFALWPLHETAALRHALMHSDTRKVQEWTKRYHTLEIDFTPAAQAAIDPFFNINTPDDLATAERWLAQKGNQSRRS